MHAYALIKKLETPISLPSGIDGALELMPVGAVSAVVERDVALEHLQQTDQALLHAILAHDRVIRELFQQITVLPLRFTSFPEPAALLADLQTNQERYLEKLAQLDGKAEYNLKLTPVLLTESSTIASNLKGKDYFLAKKQQFQSLQNQQFQQVEELETLVATVAEWFPNHQILPATESGQTLYLLVNEAEGAQLEGRLSSWQANCALWQLSLSERLPPYHFTGQ